jgi:hypothetical protein
MSRTRETASTHRDETRPAPRAPERRAEQIQPEGRRESAGYSIFDIPKLYKRHHDKLLVVIAVSGLAAGAAFWWAGSNRSAHLAWLVATTPVLLGLLIQIAASLRRGDVGLDVVAALSMSLRWLSASLWPAMSSPSCMRADSFSRISLRDEPGRK